MKFTINHNGTTENSEHKHIDAAIESIISKVNSATGKALVYATSASKYVFSVERKEGEHHWSHPNYRFDSFPRAMLK